jgi:purine nucleosidase
MRQIYATNESGERPVVRIGRADQAVVLPADMLVRMATKIILDCDPGHDDAVALLLAWGSPEIDLVGVTTVSGNQTIEKVTRNALAIARVAGITGVPFARGAHRPLVRQVETSESIHGESGLDGPVLPEPAIELDPRHAVDFIIDTVLAAEPKTITLVPTGALTNIALAVRKEPRIADLVKEVVLMGGGVHVGNSSAVAEFNIVVDPEAAHIVFHESWPLTMIGLDLTHQALATRPSPPPSRQSTAGRPVSWASCSSISGGRTSTSRASSTRPCTTRAPSRT